MITATQCRRRIDFSARDRHPQPLSRAGREASTKPPRGRTQRDSAPTVRKTPLQVVSPAFLERLLGPGRPRPQLTSRSSAGNRFRTCHWPGYPYASCIAGRKPAATWSSSVHRSPVGAGFFTCITVQCASQVGNLRLRGRPACVAASRCRFFYLHHRSVCGAGRKPAATWSSGVRRSP